MESSQRTSASFGTVRLASVFDHRLPPLLATLRPATSQTAAMKAYLLSAVIVLLCHILILAWQQGHRGSNLASARAMVVRSVDIELGTWRLGRIGGTAGSIICG